MDNNKRCSTLGKYLPREKSKINQNCNFINNFCKHFYPDEYKKNRFAAYQLYRQLKTRFTKYLCVLEYNLCTKNYENINWNKISNYSIKKNMNTIRKESILYKSYISNKFKMFSNCSLSKFMKNIFNDKNAYDIENNKHIIDVIWKINIPKYIKKYNFTNINVSECNLIYDLSRQIFNFKQEYFVIGLILLFNEYNCDISKNENLKDLNTHNNIVDKCKFLNTVSGPIENMNFNENSIVIVNNNVSHKITNYKLLFVIRNEVHYDVFIKYNNENKQIYTQIKLEREIKIDNNDNDLVSIKNIIHKDKSLTIGINPSNIVFIIFIIWLIMFSLQFLVL